MVKTNVCIGYMFRDREATTIDILDPYLKMGLRKVGNKEFAAGYGDGFEGLAGWDSLITGLSKLKVTHIIMPNLCRWEGSEEKFTAEVAPLIERGISLVVTQAPMINGGYIDSPQTIAQAIVLLRSQEYYKTVRNMRISAGMKHTSRGKGGRTPYGMLRLDNGSIVADAINGPIVKSVMNYHISDIPISEIASAENLMYSKVRDIIQYWEEKPWQKIFSTV